MFVLPLRPPSLVEHGNARIFVQLVQSNVDLSQSLHAQAPAHMPCGHQLVEHLHAQPASVLLHRVALLTRKPLQCRQ